MPNRLHLVVAGAEGNPTRCTRKDLSCSPMIPESPVPARVGPWTGSFPRAVPDRKRLELTSNEAVKQAVLAGLGWSIMPVMRHPAGTGAGRAADRSHEGLAHPHELAPHPPCRQNPCHPPPVPFSRISPRRRTGW